MGLIFIIGAVIIGGYLWWDSGRAKRVASPKPVTANVNDEANRKRLERVVNTHIQVTNQKIEIEKEQIKVEASFTVPRVGEFVIQKNEGADSFNQRSDRTEMNAARDLRRETQITMSANDIIQAEMANLETQSEYDRQYREEYARQFVDNARRNGYEVKLSPDYKVIGVKPLGGPSAYRGNGESFR